MDNKATENNVKLFGRTYFDGQSLWCAFSATGIEFYVYGGKCEIEILGDSISEMGKEEDFAHFGIIINGEMVVNELVRSKKKVYALPSEKLSDGAVVTVIKLSETAMSTFGIGKITTEGKIKPTPEKKLKIEIIGDSITCGFGVEDEVAEHLFRTETENVTKSYSYKTMKAVDADYSLVSISGYGIISGYTGEGVKVPEQTIPQYYEKFGFSYGRINGVAPSDILWDFNRFTPELIIINLGTNDDSYCLDFEDRQNDYKENYIAFLKKVRGYNPYAKILCSLGIMGDRLCTIVEKAVSEYSTQTNDTNISTMRFEVQQPENGFAACWHPTEKTHNIATRALVKEISKLLKLN